MDKLRKHIKGFIPPVFWNLAVHGGGTKSDSIRFIGDFRRWEEAARQSAGYPSPKILEATRVAMRKVRAGQAKYERDSVLFSEIDLPFPVIATMLRAAAEHGNKLSVLDFGGSLGSSWVQCRDFLGSVEELYWRVVEQPAYVDCGQQEFSNEELTFHYAMRACVELNPPTVMLFSGVLQYLPEPYTTLDEALSYRAPYILVDRTTLLKGDRDRLTIQQVPASIYEASYPVWFFSESKFRACFEKDYMCLASFPAIDRPRVDGEAAFCRGFIFKLRT